MRVWKKKRPKPWRKKSPNCARGNSCHSRIFIRTIFLHSRDQSNIPSRIRRCGRYLANPARAARRENSFCNVVHQFEFLSVLRGLSSANPAVQSFSLQPQKTLTAEDAKERPRSTRRNSDWARTAPEFLRKMRRFIITGAPGAGKTAIIRQLELDGFSVVEEAATGVIAVAQARSTA